MLNQQIKEKCFIYKFIFFVINAASDLTTTLVHLQKK